MDLLSARADVSSTNGQKERAEVEEEEEEAGEREKSLKYRFGKTDTEKGNLKMVQRIYIINYEKEKSLTYDRTRRHLTDIW